MRVNKEVQVIGMDEVRAALKRLPMSIQVSITRSALRAGAKVMATKIASKTPTRKGQVLRKSIIAQTRVIKGKSRDFPESYRGEVLVKKRPGNNPRKYAHLVEFGTKPHAVGKPKKKKAKAKKAMGVTVRAIVPTRGPGMHPGAKPHRMFQEGFDEAKQAALAAALDVIKKRVPAAVRKARGEVNGKGKS
jgi:HK97 gp10 family phage protein